MTPECELYGQPGRNNLTVRKVYGAAQLRYLRGSHCGRKFSARKGTALWNTKVREAQAGAVVAHLSEGRSPASTARLAAVDMGMVQRLQAELGRHGPRFHDVRVQVVAVKAVEGDERHGCSGTKQTPRLGSRNAGSAAQVGSGARPRATGRSVDPPVAG